MDVMQMIEREHVAELAAGKEIPDFAPGDTVRVGVRVVEGEKVRVQVFEGVCIARKGRGLNANFTVRKLSFGEGVERVFPLYAPVVDSIVVVRRGRVRRAKLYYLRGRTGRAARIRELTTGGPRKTVAVPPKAVKIADADAPMPVAEPVMPVAEPAAIKAIGPEEPAAIGTIPPEAEVTAPEADREAVSTREPEEAREAVSAREPEEAREAEDKEEAPADPASTVDKVLGWFGRRNKSK